MHQAILLNGQGIGLSLNGPDKKSAPKPQFPDFELVILFTTLTLGHISSQKPIFFLI